MAVSATDESVVIPYLLGRMTEEEKLRLEEKLLANDDLYELLEQTEDDLIDAYVRGKIARSDRNDFESYFLSTPRRRDEVEFARALHQVAAEHRQSEKAKALSAAGARQAKPGIGERLLAWWQSLIAAPQFAALTAACLLLLAGGLTWSLVRNGRLREQLNQEQIARAALEQKTVAQVESLNRELGEERSLRQELIETVNQLTGSEDPKQPTFFSAVLNAFLAGLAKGGETITPQKLVIPAGADLARLQFPVQTDRFVRFDVSLIRLNGSERKEIWRKRGLAAPAGTDQNLKVRIPVALLNNGEYALKLTGIGDDNNTESVGEYRLEVVRQR